MNINIIKSPFYKKYTYPFEELRDILEEFSCSQLTSITKKQIEYRINTFKYKIIHEQSIDSSEEQYFDFTCSFGVVTKVKCKNIFTACIMYDKYIPYNFIGECSEYTFNNGDKVEYDHTLEEYMYIKKPVEIKLPESLKIEEIPLPHPPDKSETDLIFEEIKDKLESLSENELRKYCDLFGGIKFNVIYSEMKRRDQIKLKEFREQNPGVPDDATKLIAGKNYGGDLDGGFEIQTINGELWFVPKGCSGGLDGEI